jgi:hypothetical protein
VIRQPLIQDGDGANNLLRPLWHLLRGWLRHQQSFRVQVAQAFELFYQAVSAAI